MLGVAYSATRLLRIDTTFDEVHLFDLYNGYDGRPYLDFSSGHKWRGAKIVGNSLYAIPWNKQQVLKFEYSFNAEKLDLGPNDATDVTSAEATFSFTTPGTYRMCYRTALGNMYAQVGEPLVVSAGAVPVRPSQSSLSTATAGPF